MGKRNVYHGNRQKRSMMGRIAAYSRAEYNLRLDLALQLCADAAALAAAELFAASQEDTVRFLKVYGSYVNQISQLLAEDGKDDPEIVYATTTLDKAVKAAVGAEHFVPWEERYTA